MGEHPDIQDEDKLLRSVALQNAGSILIARERAEQELIRAKESLERKTEELARSLALIRATLESTTDGVLVLDADVQVVDYNSNFLAMWQISDEIARDRAGILGVVHEQFTEPEAARGQLEAIMASATPASMDVVELADGRVFERFSKLQRVEGGNAGRVWIFRDITERRRAQERLQEDARILELLNATGAALATKLDLPSLAQAVTDAATELSGARFGAFFYNQTNENGESYLLYSLSGAQREAFEHLGQPRPTAVLGPTFHGGPPIRCADVTQDPRYGQMGGMPKGHLPVRSYLAVAVVSRSGEVIGGLFFGHPEPDMFTERSERLIVGIAAQAAVGIDNARLYESAQRAATERQALLDSERSLRAAAQHMSDLKDEFLANLSHELRTPLNAILGWAQMLRLGKGSAAEHDKGLEAIERNARVQSRLIEDLLDMNRIMSGKVRLDVQSIEPSSFVEAAIDTVGPAAAAKGIRIESLLDPTAGPVLGDPNRMQQVMWNLLSNAIKFTPRGGKVQVVLERVNSHVEISVADTGIGIGAEFVPHVFDRFRQADASTTRRHGGLGLGLSIVKDLVELHGGSVRVESPGADRGTTFSVHLPVAVVHRSPQSEPRLHPTAPPTMAREFDAVDLVGIKVLVVDDELDARELIKHVLIECGAEVSTAGSAAEALRLLELERPHVLLSDIGMPDVDGYELLRRVRALDRTLGYKVPAIALTAFARSADRVRALSAGFLLHISKPVEPSELAAATASVLRR